jgi:F-type H+-transporting ATPase subunit delta
MAEPATVARPYARAAFEHARGADALAAWADFLAAAAHVARDPQMAAVLGNPELPRERVVGLLSEIVGATGVALDERQKNFLNLLAENHRLALLGDIAAAYALLRAEAERTIEIEVVSALPLTDEQRSALARALAKRFERTVQLKESVDPELIGGAVIRAGDLVIDGSLKSRVEQLATRMAAA